MIINSCKSSSISFEVRSRETAMSDIPETEEVDAYPPWNFSWVIPNELAAMAFPRNKENLQFLVNEGIKHLVTLSPEKQPPIEDFTQFKWIQIPVDEFEAPSMKNIQDFIDLCTKCRSKREPVGVHCRQGRGRTGVMLACYLVAFQDLAPQRAVINIRLLRPGSCETHEQERAVIHYHDVLRGTKTDYEIVDNKVIYDKAFKSAEGGETNGEVANHYSLSLAECSGTETSDNPEDSVDAYAPWNFSWVIPSQLAAMAFPRNKENLQYLVNEGVKYLITLSPEKKPPIEDCPELKWAEIPIDEFEVPSVKSIKDFLDIATRCCSKGEALGVHSRHGRGRTGIMLACYLMAFKNLTPEQAISDIRELRPGSCELEEQEEAVKQYYEFLRGSTKMNYNDVDNDAKLIENKGEVTVAS